MNLVEFNSADDKSLEICEELKGRKFIALYLDDKMSTVLCANKITPEEAVYSLNKALQHIIANDSF